MSPIEYDAILKEYEQILCAPPVAILGKNPNALSSVEKLARKLEKAKIDVKIVGKPKKLIGKWYRVHTF